MENEIIKTCKTKSEAIRKLYGYHNGSSQKKFERLIENKKINIQHLTSKPSKYETITKICPVCGNEFKTKIGNKEEKTTCSYSCSNTYFRSGSSNPNWKEERYRSTCFEQHKKECIICGEYKIVTVHHYDENRKNNNVENLIPLCPTHHQYVHSRYKDEVMDKIDEYRDNFIKQRLM
jgi:hypothetical protein